jgi:hypothetical protein
MNTELTEPSAEDIAAAKQELIRIRLNEIKDEAVNDLQQLRSELKRRQWRENGPLWAEERLGDSLWSMQRTVMHSVRANRKTLVKSCHDIGKSYIAGVIAAWWLDIYAAGEAFVVTTAPTTAQVKAILWREIGRAHTRGHLRGRVNQTEWYMTGSGGDREEIVAFGRKPDEYDPAAFQGIHAQNVLVIIDEANGVRGPLHDAADSLIANDTGKILMIGNPDDPTGEFFEASKPNSGWAVHSISAFDSPNFTDENVPARVRAALIGRTYVEERRKKWAPRWTWTADNKRCEPPADAKSEDTHPFWQSKILGEFPVSPQGVHTLLPLPWIRAAQQRTINPKDSDPIELGCDVGGGGDASTIAMAKAGLVRVLREDRNPDTMQTVEQILIQLDVFKAINVKVDEIGIGRGVVDRGKELNKPFIGINVGRASHEPDRFSNLRAQFWWYVRSLFELGQIDIDPDDEDLEAELASLRYKTGSRGQIQMESKDEARRRGVASPNRADAVMLAICDPFAFTELNMSSVDAFGDANADLHRTSTWGFAR